MFVCMQNTHVSSWVYVLHFFPLPMLQDRSLSLCFAIFSCMILIALSQPFMGLVPHVNKLVGRHRLRRIDIVIDNIFSQIFAEL